MIYWVLFESNMVDNKTLQLHHFIKSCPLLLSTPWFANRKLVDHMGWCDTKAFRSGEISVVQCPFAHLLWLYPCFFLDYGSFFVFVLVIVFPLPILFFISVFEKNLVAANLFRSRLFLSRSSSRACQQVDCYLFSELNSKIYVIIYS